MLTTAWGLIGLVRKGEVLELMIAAFSLRLRWHSWVRFEPKMGTLLAPWRGSRPVFFALAELSASLAPVYRFYLGRRDDVLPRRRAGKRGNAATNRFAN